MRGFVLVWGLIFLVPCVTWGGTLKGRECVARARVFERDRVYFSNPEEAQRILRECIREDSTNTAAYYFLGRSYWRDSGKIEKALFLFRKKVDFLADKQKDDKAYKGLAKHEQDEIKRLFRPLRVGILDRQIEVLSYASIELSFRFPEEKLGKEQGKRIEYLRDKRPFQFIDVDSLGRGYLQVDYFPVAEQKGVFYSIVLVDEKAGKEIRRSFRFTGEARKVVDIPWQEGWGETVVESVPETMIKLELPGKYRFRSSRKPFLELSVQGEYQNLYLPAKENVRLELRTSKERWKEVTYGALLKLAFCAGAAYGLMEAR